MPDKMAIGLLYHNPDAPRYDEISVEGLGMTREAKVTALEKALDKFAI
jgi:hypothetical protein